MKGMVSMSIRKKLILSYSVLIIGMIVMAVYGITQLRTIDSVSSNTVDSNLPRMNLMSKINVDVANYRGYSMKRMLMDDPELQQQYDVKIAEIRKDVDTTFQEYKGHALDQSKLQKIEELGSLIILR